MEQETISLILLSFVIKFFLVTMLVFAVMVIFETVVNNKVLKGLTKLYDEILLGNLSSGIFLGLVLAAFILAAGMILS